MELYVDNMDVEDSKSIQPSTTATSRSGHIVLGRYLTSGSGGTNGPVTCDSLTIWDRRLSAEERAMLAWELKHNGRSTLSSDGSVNSFVIISLNVQRNTKIGLSLIKAHFRFKELVNVGLLSSVIHSEKDIRKSPSDVL